MSRNKPIRAKPNKLAYFRKLLGWTQADLARALNVTAGSLSRWESSEVNCPSEKRGELQRLLGLSVDVLFPRG